MLRSIRRASSLILTALLAASSVACTSSDDESSEPEPSAEGLPPRATSFPSLIASSSDKAALSERATREPFSSLLSQLRETASRPDFQRESPAIFDSQAHGDNGVTAQAAAFIAWLEGDEAMGARALDLLTKLPADYETNDLFDINIRMPRVLICHTIALDLLRATPFITDEQAAEVEATLLEITGKFYDQFFDGGFRQWSSVEVTQNNHPLRTAASLGFVALAFPDHERSEQWANWAFGEHDYLWGENGHYVQADGGVSEGPFYYNFALAASVPLLLAWEERSGGKPRTLKRDCSTRVDTPPWTDHGCVEGEPFTFDNPMKGERFRKALEWSMALRMPDGDRPPLEDANVLALHGGAATTGLTGVDSTVWDFMHQVDRDYPLNWGMGLEPQHFVYLPDDPGAVPEPSFRSRIMKDAGQAVFRSGWGSEDIWALMTAEHGAARMTIHDHVDATSFSLHAYGEYLLIDTGYYKPNSLNNARTSGADAHSLLLIDGEPIPKKGLLDDFGDTDAFLENDVLEDSIGYVEARLPLEQSTIERSLAFVRDRYLVVADHVETGATAPRKHTWRLHGNAGYDAGGSFVLGDDTASWERSKAGVDVFLGSTAPGLVLEEPPMTEGEAPHVHQFDRNRNVGEHAVLDGVVEAVAPGFLAVAVPYRVGGTGMDARLSVTRLAESEAGVVAWKVTHTAGSELVVLREAGAAGTLMLDGTALETDARLVIVSADAGDRVALMARGTTLSVDGQVVLMGDGTGAVAVGR